MYNIMEIILPYATDSRVIFAVGSVFGYSLCKFMTMAKRRRNYRKKSSEESDTESSETDSNDAVYTDEYDNYKLVLLIRTDLKMGKGKVAAQCSHAAVAAYKSATKYPKILRAWVESGQPKITLKVDSENELLTLAAKAKSTGLLSNVIRDAGHTQIPAGSVTVCAVGPGPAKFVDKVTGRLKLF
ncbi:Peptidyl-tRNA hydrolase 2, mitochondrial [Ooceraea biroi]|uniref:peptidyl-tRNA hydrolase n=1 Tax=Ooceraea biroi TaxID=2015173 RepID=A0A026W5Q2_OOCBI|nr:Peptidyl-tRNA hydrolase 2, mitochondrial [Ooceraea biroi]